MLLYIITYQRYFNVNKSSLWENIHHEIRIGGSNYICLSVFYWNTKWSYCCDSPVIQFEWVGTMRAFPGWCSTHVLWVKLSTLCCCSYYVSKIQAFYMCGWWYNYLCMGWYLRVKRTFHAKKFMKKWWDAYYGFLIGSNCRVVVFD